jgi:hypothetical protein
LGAKCEVLDATEVGLEANDGNSAATAVVVVEPVDEVGESIPVAALAMVCARASFDSCLTSLTRATSASFLSFGNEMVWCASVNCACAFAVASSRDAISSWNNSAEAAWVARSSPISTCCAEERVEFGGVCGNQRGELLCLDTQCRRMCFTLGEEVEMLRFLCSGAMNMECVDPVLQLLAVHNGLRISRLTTFDGLIRGEHTRTPRVALELHGFDGLDAGRVGLLHGVLTRASLCHLASELLFPRRRGGQFVFTQLE